MRFLMATFVILARSATFSLIFPMLAFAGLATDIQEGTQITNPQQQIIFSDNIWGAAADLNISDRVLRVNNVDQTTLTTSHINWNGSYSVTFSPSTEYPLPQGDLNVNLTIPYKWFMFWHFWESEKSHEVNIYVDSLPPQIEILSPAAGEIISDSQTSLIFSITDTGIGVDASSIGLFINDEDKTSLTTFANGELVFTPDTVNPLPEGNLQVKIIADDLLGNQSAVIFTVVVETKVVLSATPIAIPQTAYAPADIRFSPEVTTGNAIQVYKWDFNGDGVFDNTDIIGNSYTHNYNTPGDYTVTLEVTDNLGEVTTGTVVVHILNASPQVAVEAAPSNGQVPLTVSFSVVATDNEGISQYEWDFDGDGVYDYSSPSTGNTSHTYTVAGQYSATLRVTDSLGEVTTYSLPTTTVNAAVPGSPSVTATVDIGNGPVPLTVTLAATATDPQNKTFILWEWDFDGDGIYDYSDSQNATISHTYTAAGTYYPHVRVTTDDNRSSVDTIEIKVENSLTLTRDLDTIDAGLNEQSTITTTLGGITTVKVVIENRAGQVVRTLVDWVERDGGVYHDVWDGRDDNNIVMPEGDYYAVLLYREAGLEKRLDLRVSSGGDRYNPSRNNAARTFSPFANDPMNITFTLPRSSEVTAFMGYSNSNTRIVTFMSRRPMGKGSHTILWYGTNNEGVLITPPAGHYFMFGVWAYNLADNAIYVKSGAYIHSVTATPPIYDPTTHDENGLRSKSIITFTLTNDASVELIVSDAQSGIQVASKTYQDLPAGGNSITWDGRSSTGDLLAPGKYRLGLRATDAHGYRSLTEYILQRIYY